MTNPDPIARAVDLQLAITRELRGLPPDPWRELDLTMPQLKVLLALNALGPSRVGNLASELGVKLPTLTGILDRLVEAGLVCRNEDPRDRRVVIGRLTREGATLVERLHQASRTRLEHVFARLAPDEQRTLAEILEKVLAAARAERAEERGESAGHEAPLPTSAGGATRSTGPEAVPAEPSAPSGQRLGEATSHHSSAVADHG